MTVFLLNAAFFKESAIRKHDVLCVKLVYELAQTKIMFTKLFFTYTRRNAKKNWLPGSDVSALDDY